MARVTVLIIAAVFIISAAACSQIIPLGTTWYDIQHHSSGARQIQVDRDGWIHAAWMNHLGGEQRHIYYQVIDSLLNPLFPGGGVQVDQAIRSGYCAMELLDDIRGVTAFHQERTINPNNHAAIGADYISRSGAFATYEPPQILQGGVDVETLWPRIVIDRNRRFHILSFGNPIEPNSPYSLYYIRAEYDTTNYSFSFSPQWDFIDTTRSISAAIAASPVSDRAAVGMLKPCDPNIPGGNGGYDLALYLSPDGINWNWADTVNVTNWIPPDPNLLPDTARANRDTFRCSGDIDLIFDYNDNLHIFFTTRGYWHFSGWRLSFNSFIWHWDEFNQVFSLAANGWFENRWNNTEGNYVSRPSAGIDTTTGEIYLVYQRFLQPTGPSPTNPFPYLIGDTTDTSTSGYLNGDIWLTKSSDGGISWREGFNFTNTYSPGAGPGDCFSEKDPSLAPEVVNNACHVFYVIDKFAGEPFTNSTLNDVKYQRILLAFIPAMDTIPPYPMHCDSTGMPGVQSVENPGGGKVPRKFTLYQPYPNPFNQRSLVSFYLEYHDNIRLSVYDIQGREVAQLAEGLYDSGMHRVKFDGSELSSGMYFVRLEAGEAVMVKKVVLLK